MHIRYTGISPKRFSVGDIVEVRLATMAVPTFTPPGSIGQYYKLALVLRSLALIDNSFSKVSHCILYYKYLSNLLLSRSLVFCWRNHFYIILPLRLKNVEYTSQMMKNSTMSILLV